MLLNLLAVLWLGLCYLASYTNPEDIRYIPLFSLTTPYAFIANILFASAWLIFSRRKLRALVSILAMAASYQLLLMMYGFNFFDGNDMTTADNRLTVMNWNAHGMGIFDKPDYTQQENDIISYLQKANPDIVCLPEFPTAKETIMNKTAQKIIDANGYKDYRFQADNTLGKYTFLGTAIFSKYPIYNYKSHRLSDYIYMLQGDIVPNSGDTLRMFFVHLHTFGLSDNDKEYIEALAKTDTKAAEKLARSKSFIWKFNYAYVLRAREVKVAKSVIDSSPYPVVMCGDFNDLPASYTYTRFTEHLTDAFVEKGRGFGRTYSRLSPTLRIDYIFYDSDALRCIGYKSSFSSLSDHNPVIANFELLNSPRG